jgi:hypothetical protein
VTALTITPGAPPKMANAWCAAQNGGGALAVSTTDGQSNFLVWALGGGRLRAFDGDTGAVGYAGGGAGDGVNGVGRFQSPMIAKGAVYVGSATGLARYH